jgi:hypothetical protein
VIVFTLELISFFGGPFLEDKVPIITQIVIRVDALILLLECVDQQIQINFSPGQPVQLILILLSLLFILLVLAHLLFQLRLQGLVLLRRVIHLLLDSVLQRDLGRITHYLGAVSTR